MCLGALRAMSHCGVDLLCEIPALRWDIAEAAAQLGSSQPAITCLCQSCVNISKALACQSVSAFSRSSTASVQRRKPRLCSGVHVSSDSSEFYNWQRS